MKLYIIYKQAEKRRDEVGIPGRYLNIIYLVFYRSCSIKSSPIISVRETAMRKIEA